MKIFCSIKPKRAIHAVIDKSSGGGSSIEIEPVLIDSNGTYTADVGKAYSPVTVSLPYYDGTVILWQP